MVELLRNLFFIGSKRVFLLGGLASFIQAAIDLYFTLVITQFLAEFLFDSAAGDVILDVKYSFSEVLLLLIVRFVIQIVLIKYNSLLAQDEAANCRFKLNRRLSSLNLIDFDRRDESRDIYIFFELCNQFSNGIFCFFKIFSDCLVLLFLILAMFYFHPMMVLFLITVFGSLCWPFLAIKRRLAIQAREVNSFGILLVDIVSRMHGNSIERKINPELPIFGKLANERISKYRSALSNLIFFSGAFRPFLELFFLGALVMAVGIGWSDVDLGSEVIVSAGLLLRTIPVFSSLSATVSQLFGYAPGLLNLAETLAKKDV